MITEDYVSFEVAKLLKEKGFKFPCRAYYTTNGRLIETEVLHNWNNPAPTLQVVIKWLEIEYGLIILKDYVDLIVKGPSYKLSVLKINKDRSIDDTFESYCVYDKDYNNGCNKIIKHCLE